MKKVLVILIFFSYDSFSQSTPDYAKISKACELWGLIKYFHPDTPGNDFDSAFAVSVPRMLTAKNDDDWNKLLAQWLIALNDNNTLVSLTEHKKPGEEHLKSEFDTDGTLVITISGESQLSDFNRMSKFFQGVEEQLAKAKGGIVFDLRQEAGISPENEGYLSYYFESINSVLATGIVPQFKSKYYSGFKPEKGGTSGGYTINNVVHDAIKPGSFETRNQRVAWLVNKYSELPVVALAQQASGVGIIVGNSANVNDMLPLSRTFSLSETLTVEFKTTDIIMPNGSYPVIDYTYSAIENPLEISRKLLSNKVSQSSLPKDTRPVKRHLDNSTTYPADTYPSVGYRVLAAAKIFTVIETFFPYYQFMDNDWRAVLTSSLPDFVSATNDIEYGLAVAKMYANINDSHGFIFGNKGQLQLQGEAVAPIVVDWIEDKVVITQFRNDSICTVNGMSIGDVVNAVNGVPVNELMKKFDTYFAHSTMEPIKQRAAWYAVRGPENQMGTFAIEDKSGKRREVKLKWTNTYNRNFRTKYMLDTLALLNEKIGYADLTRMEAAQTDKMFEKFKNTKAIIFDMRGYPKGTAWSIAPRLTDKKNVPLALFRKPEVLSPKIKSGDLLSSRSYTEFVQTIGPSDKWKYKGRTIMLINHQAISQAEHTGLFFESVNNTMFVGSPTVGANGDVTNFEIPGGMFLYFSGQGVWHADGRPLQRVGLKPHLFVKPTVKGIRSGKDEVLDKAIEWINMHVK